jgi:isoquinoline 1-oxidoreductase beta subunit
MNAVVTTCVLSRRSFLVSTGAVSFAVAFGSLRGVAAAAGAAFKPNAWITIGGDGIVTIMAPAAEMGQGVMTALPALIAEDLDADWAKVKVVQAPPDAKTYGNPAWFGTLQTSGSKSVRGYYEKLRLVGAQTRLVLLANAAAAWKVPVGELSTEPGIVVHRKSGRRIGYGKLARTATVPDPLPPVTKADLKPLARCRLIGKDLARVELPSKVNGSAQYGIDTQLPDMLYAAVLHPPVAGETPAAIDDAAALAVPGILKIVTLPTGIGVIGKTVYATRKAKAALKVTWTTTSETRGYTSTAVAEDYRAIAGDLAQTGIAMIKDEGAAAALAGAAKVVTAEYLSDHVAHTCMEPMNATAVARCDTIEFWTGTQSPTTLQGIAAAAAGVPVEKIDLRTPLLGGGFGGRSDADYVVEAVLLAKAVPERPVKLIWTREDDIQRDKYRALAVQRIDVGLDADNNIVGWRHRIVCESYFARAAAGLYKTLGGKDPVAAGGGEFRYAMPARAVEWVRAPRGVAVSAWRATSAGYTKFAVEAMVDEIAALKGADPVSFRIGMLQKEPRAVAVIEAAAAMADWRGKRAPGKALGFAYSDALDSYTAAVAEVSLDAASGTIKVHRIWCAVDCGIAVQPRNIVAQIESSAAFGVGAALFEQITLENGEVQETNFGEYRVPRMSDMPVIETRVISTDNPPTGLGEAGVPVIAPAIANAVAALTGGKRLRQLPMLPERVKAVLSV